MKTHHVLAAFLALIAAALYARMLGAGFVWDSRAQILTDTFIHQPRNLGAILSLRVLGMDVLDNNRPLALLSLLLDALVWGGNPAGYHLTNVLLHASVVALLFYNCSQLLRTSGADEMAATVAAGLAALLFAVHPVNCEAVAEPSYREDLLAAFFVLLGLLLAQNFARTGARVAAAGSALSCFAAVTAKETGVAGPIALALYWLLFHRGERRGFWLVGAASLLVGGFTAARFWFQPKDSAIFAGPAQYLGGSFADAALIQPRIWALYFRQIVWPLNLCADYGAFSIRGFSFGISLGVLLAVLLAQFFLALRNRVFALGAAIFWLALLPVSNLVPIFRPIADRFLYFPMAGVALMLASLLPRERKWIAVVCIAATIALATVTFRREAVWHDELALWSDTIARNPQSFTAANNLGFALLHAGRPVDAARSFQRAATLGRDADCHAGLAVAYETAGRSADANAAFREAVRRDARMQNPDALVRSLAWEPSDADLLRPIAARNPSP